MAVEKRAGSKGKDLLILIALIVIGVAAIAGFGFYQEEVKAFFRLEAWNLGAVTGATRQFIHAAAAGDGERVGAMVVPGSQTVQVATEGSKVTGLMVPAYGGPRRVPLKELAPSENPEIGPPRLSSLNGGSVAQTVTFPGSHILKIGWDKTPAGWKIKDLDVTAGGR
jgi:hypothetical protein